MAVPTDQKIRGRACRLPVAQHRHHARLPCRSLLTLLLLVAILSGCGDAKKREPSDVVEEEVIVVASGQAAAPDNELPQQKDVPSDTPPTAKNETNTVPTPAQPQNSETVTGPRWRLSDDRPDINERRLQAAGIRVERSQRLILLTDLPSEQTVGLCQLADQLFEKLEQDFGPLPAAADGSAFQVTGHLIGETERFASIGLMPAAELTFRHGRHVNYQFWMNNPDSDYYRRHLLLHEFTHCFMTCESGMTDIPPLWYIEGMAEYFATHQIDVDGSVAFGVMPSSYEGFEGWGRISELRRVARLDAEAIAAGRPPDIEKIGYVMREAVTSQQDVDYAWWWGVCWMLQNHPGYAEDFAQFRTHQRRAPFLQSVRDFLQQHESTLATDWLLFVESLESGFRPAGEFAVARTDQWTLNAAKMRSVSVRPEKGWMSTGLHVNAGERVRIRAQGRYAMNEPASDWPCEPQGVSVEYVRGQPLGILLATVVADDGSRIQRRQPIGTDAELTAEFTGTIWLQINDHSDDRHNNSGMLSVSLQSP